MKKKILLSVAVAGIVFSLTGCGSSSCSTSTNESASTTTTQNSESTQNTQKTIKVVDGYVIGAKVCDANNVCATTDKNGTATANFADTILTSTAGYIDVNYNSEIDENDIELPNTFTLKAPAGKSVISPLTDLIANGADAAKLAQVLGVNEEDLYADPIATNNVDLAKAMQIVYAIKIEGKETEFIDKINNTNIETVSQSTSNTTSNVQSDLPDFGSKVVSDLPDFGSDTTSNVATTQTESTSNTLTGSLSTFANLALSVVTDENSKSLINQVVSLNVTDVKEIETSIATIKKELAQMEENTTNEEMNTAQSENITAETNTTQSENVATETTTTQSENVTAETDNTQQTTNETETNEVTNQDNTSSVQSDLPVW